MRTGLFGGTFDPIHVGHLDVAVAARRALELDCVRLVPASVPPHRSAPRASAAHRFAMAALAVASLDGLVVSDIEMAVGGPSYTSDTLDRVEASGTRLGQVYFITGADAFRDIASWRNYPALLDRCHFVVVSRPGVPAGLLREAMPALAPRMRDAPCATPAGPSIFLVDAPTTGVSSTDVRRALAAGASLAGLVPAAVEAHIVKHGLYGAHGPKGDA